MARRPPGLLFVPSHVIPAMHPRSVVTIHDLAYLTHPEAFSKRERGELDMATRWNARVATKVIAVSRRTKLDLIEHYGVDPEKIVVIHHGVSGRFQPADLHEIERVRKTYLLERDYVLCVGTIHPRKNYPRVISAFEQAIEAGLEADLVICGDAGSRSATTLEAIDSSTVRESIRYLRYADFGDLPALYSGSSLVMLASLYEGFGMPALEAMACGAPVVASTCGALPEVAGSAARLVDPLDVGSISDAMVEICASTETRNRLSILGQRWARRFTWERSAGLTMSVLRAVRDGKAINDEQLGWSDMVAAPPQSLSKDGDT
jgi:glycosyltransferase involved in cell wall biosynthesis